MTYFPVILLDLIISISRIKYYINMVMMTDRVKYPKLSATGALKALNASAVTILGIEEVSDVPVLE